MNKFRFYPLSYAHDRVFLNSPHRSPEPKKFPKDRGVSADLIHTQGDFRVKNQTYAATTTPHRSRLQSYDCHIFVNVLKDVSTCIVESVFTYYCHDYINRTRAHVLIYAINISLLQYIGLYAPCHALSVSLVFLELKQTPRKKGRSNRPYMYIL